MRIRPAKAVGLSLVFCMTGCTVQAASTVGGGSIDKPAEGPAAAYSYDDSESEFILVKNWDFGTGEGSTITSQAVMNEHFQYHDQFGWFANGTKYGAFIVAPDEANSLTAKNQPIEGVNTDRPVREFTEESIKTFLVPLDGAERVHPAEQKAGSGSFHAKWTLDAAGSRLGRDILWETRVRFKAVPYYWYAIWVSGNKWNKGAEIDLVESFGYDNGGGVTNFDGGNWHSSVVGGTQETDYHANWPKAMASYGFRDFDPWEWHTWTMLYKADNSFVLYLDGKVVQRGELEWTFGATADGEPIDMNFIFDGTWGHRVVRSVNHWLEAEKLKDAVYEWDYSRVYLSKELKSAPAAGPTAD